MDIANQDQTFPQWIESAKVDSVDRILPKIKSSTSLKPIKSSKN